MSIRSPLSPLFFLYYLWVIYNPWGKAKTPLAVESAISEDHYQKSNTAEVSLQTYLVLTIQATRAHG